jgi:hypothetical protein
MGSKAFKILVITALTYRSITSGYLYGLSFKVDGKPCYKESLKLDFIVLECDHPPINGYGMLLDREDGLFLSWYDCLHCGYSDIVKITK